MYFPSGEKKQRKHYAPEEKVAILRRHLLEKEPTSKLSDDVGLQPAVFYRWEIQAELDPKVQEARKQWQIRRQGAA